MPTVDHAQLIDMLRKQVELTPDRFLGAKIHMAFRALELEVGPDAAAAQVAFIINEYLDEKLVA